MGAGWSSLPSLSAVPASSASLRPAARETDPVLLFQGDSITDAGRSREHTAPNRSQALGTGYAALAASELLGTRPDSTWACYNRGVGGDKVGDLAARWDADALALEPDVLSILVGVNDFWHTLSGNHDGTPERYEETYRALLDRTREALPSATLLLGEPFALRGGSAVDERWQPDFQRYREAARRVAEDYDTAWIPYQSVFNDALQDAPAPYWSRDGVHPTPAGHYRMAQAWLAAFREHTE
jgi:lysophospholipase L1-like esterase